MQDYLSGELVPMALAQNYYQWITRGFRQHLGKVVCELGAGIGTFSSLLLKEGIHHLILVEPSANLLPRLCRRFEGEGWVRSYLEVLRDERGSAFVRSAGMSIPPLCGFSPVHSPVRPISDTRFVSHTMPRLEETACRPRFTEPVYPLTT